MERGWLPQQANTTNLLTSFNTYVLQLINENEFSLGCRILGAPNLEQMNEICVKVKGVTDGYRRFIG